MIESPEDPKDPGDDARMPITDVQDDRLASCNFADPASAAAVEYHDRVPDPAPYRRRKAGLSELLTFRRLSAGLAFLAFWVYVFLYQVGLGYLGYFGATPEEVGIDQPTLIVRAAIIGAALVTAMGLVWALASFGALVVATYVKSIIKVHRSGSPGAARGPRAGHVDGEARGNNLRNAETARIWSRNEIGSIKRRTAGLVIASSLLTYSAMLIGRSTNNLLLGRSIVTGIIFLISMNAMFSAAFYLAARRSWLLCLSIAGVLLAAISVFGARDLGTRVGFDVLYGHEPTVSLSDLGLQGDSVRVYPLVDGSASATLSDTSSNGVRALPQCAILLGHTDGVILLADAGGTLYRISDRSVALKSVELSECLRSK